MRKIHSLGLVGAVALVLAAVVAPAANGAVTRVETDQFSGVASAQALDLSLLGRKLTFGIASADSAANVVANTLNQKASGIGTLLSPKTAITAAQGAQPAEGGRACFQPPLGEALAGANLPSLLIGEVACGEAITKGDLNTFEAIGTGTVASLKLNATQILKPALDVLQPLLGTVGQTPVGELLKVTDAPTKTAVTTINGVLGSLLGQGSVVLPTLEPSQTLTNLVDRLQDSDLLRVNIGNAIAKNTGTPDKFVSESIAQGGTIEVLPAFRGLGLPPLLKITTGESGASVSLQPWRGQGCRLGQEHPRPHRERAPADPRPRPDRPRRPEAPRDPDRHPRHQGRPRLHRAGPRPERDPVLRRRPRRASALSAPRSPSACRRRPSSLTAGSRKSPPA